MKMREPDILDVALEEILTSVGHPGAIGIAIQRAEDLGLTVGLDWQRRPAVSKADARSLCDDLNDNPIVDPEQASATVHEVDSQWHMPPVFDKHRRPVPAISSPGRPAPWAGPESEF